MLPRDALHVGTKRVHVSASKAERTDDNAGDHGGQEVEMAPLKVLAIALALAAASPAAHAAKAVRVPFANCSIHYDAKFHTRFRDLPKEIQRDIVENSGPIAERGEQYHSTDTVIEGDAEYNAIPRRRFVGAAEHDWIWVIWYEGMGRRLHVTSYWFVLDSAFPSTGPKHRGSLTAPRPCFVTDALLSGSTVEERRSGTAP
jgi:hypothetical protein